MDNAKSREPQETEWVLRAQQGDREAFGGLVEKYQRRIFSVVFHLVRQRDVVEDLAQEIFFKVFRSIRSYDFRASFPAWLSRVAVNHCYDYLRKIRASRVSYMGQLPEESRRQLEARRADREDGRVDAEQQAALRDLVSKLLDRAPPDDRVMLVLKEVEGMSVEEISERMQLKPSTVKVRLHRARKRMLQDLKRWQGGK